MDMCHKRLIQMRWYRRKKNFYAMHFSKRVWKQKILKDPKEAVLEISCNPGELVGINGLILASSIHGVHRVPPPQPKFSCLRCKFVDNYQQLSTIIKKSKKIPHYFPLILTSFPLVPSSSHLFPTISH